MVTTPWFALVALLLLGSSACSISGAQGEAAAVGEEIVTWEVAPQRVDCTGEMPQRCLLVREPPSQEWTRFYNSIDGFTYEEGNRYRIRVARTRRPNPPADASAFTYRLVDVLSKERVAPGDTVL